MHQLNGTLHRVAERDLTCLVAGMDPVSCGTFVFATAPVGFNAADTGVRATIVESEGTTVVLPRDQAVRRGLAYDGEFEWITLRVYSALDSVGFTAAVSGALADAGIGCNVLAGYHHDHVLVPTSRASEAMAVLRALAQGCGGRGATAPRCAGTGVGL